VSEIYYTKAGLCESQKFVKREQNNTFKRNVHDDLTPLSSVDLEKKVIPQKPIAP